MTATAELLPVSSEDRAMAEEWRDVLCHRDSEYSGDAVADLAADFCRHRLAAVAVKAGEGAEDLKAVMDSEVPTIGQGEYAYAKREELPAMLLDMAKDAIFFECEPHVVQDAWNIVRMAATELNAALAPPATDPVARCIEIVREVRESFLSEEYATPQPLGSTQERFACDRVLAAIREAFPCKS